MYKRQDKEFAYVSQGDVYFRVSKSKDYAKLANKNLADLLAGASGPVSYTHLVFVSEKLLTRGSVMTD